METSTTDNLSIPQKPLKWMRAEDGAIFGVCKGLAETLEMPVGMVRLLLIASIIAFGVGFGLYILLAIALPRRDRAFKALEPRVLGVCAHFARKNDVEVGLVRFLALMLLVGFSLFTLIGYFVAYILLPDGKSSVSRSNPSVPPSTT